MKEDKELQIENGNFTRIVNRVIDELVKTHLLGAEFAVCLVIIRKTYGFNKTEDEISLSQFEKATGLSRPTIVKAIKKLKLVNMVLLAKTGNEKGEKNVYKFNKYYDQWQLVKTPLLGKKLVNTGLPVLVKTPLLDLVKTGLHTKDIIKNNTKNIKREIEISPPLPEESPPKEKAQKFFESVEAKNSDYQNFIEMLVGKGYDRNTVIFEIDKFKNYWMELNPTGKKRRYEQQKFFEVNKRLATWFQNVRKFSGTIKKEFKIGSV